jgi:hypothetical protein
MAVPASDPLIAAVPVDIRPWLATALNEGGHGWLGTAGVTETARLTLAAWSRAVNGDEAGLAAIADPEAVADLLRLLSLSQPEVRIAPDPVVARIEVRYLDPGAEVPELQLSWQFTGQLRPEPEGWAGHVWELIGRADLSFTGTGAWPWLVTSGHVRYLVSVPEYWYTSRDETAAEYADRTGSSPGPGRLVPSDTYRLRADFAEHDFRTGGTATAEVRSETTPTRYEAEDVAESAVMAEAERLIGPGEGELHPSMSHLELVRLLAPAEAEPAQPQ